MFDQTRFALPIRLGDPARDPGRARQLDRARNLGRARNRGRARMLPSLRGALGLLGVLSLLSVSGTLLVWSAPASAHAELVRTSPAQGEIVPTAPAEVTITFSEQVTPVPDKIKVSAPDGTDIAGHPSVSGAVLHIPVRTDVPRGTYLVSFRVISDDGHPVGADFSYSVGAPSATGPGATSPSATGRGATEPTVPGATEPNASGASAGDAGRTDPAVAIATSAARYLGYAGLILIAGPALMLAAFWPRRLPRTGPTRLAYAGLALVALATLLELYLQVPYGNGGGLLATSPGQFADVLTSRWGVLHLIRLGVLALVALLIGPQLSGRISRGRDSTEPGGAEWRDKARRSLLVALGVVGVATWGMAGHPGASAAPALTVIADTAHLSAMAVWLGGLVILVGFLLRRANATELGAILPVWSNWAMTAVAVLVLAGTTQALVEIGSAGALVHTTYGRLVLLKVGVLVAVLAVAAFSRRLATAGAARRSVGRLRRSVLAEIVGAVVILGLASALVQTPPAAHAEQTPPAAPAGTAAAQQPATGPYSATLTCDLYQLQVEIDPAQTGDNEVHVYAFTPQGAPLKVLEWHASAAPPARELPPAPQASPAPGAQPVEIALRPVTDAHASGQITLPTPGTWRFSFTLRTTESDKATVTTNVTVI